MTKTAQFQLPLVAPAQAQKHVTVNEALARLDALAQLRVVAADVSSPPVTTVEGAGYLVPDGATGDWDSRAGQIAIWSNGGWVFVAPRPGWRAWDESRFASIVFDGAGWVADASAISLVGASTQTRVLEFEHAISTGNENTTSAAIPAGAQVLGVTGRVTAAISGTLTGWRVGVAGSDNRYGSGLGLGLNSYLAGLSGSPVTYYSDTPLLLSAEGGSFSGGSLRLALHLTELVPPRPV
jgi:hypothetical protein